MRSTPAALALVALLASGGAGQEPARAAAPFPVSTAQAEGVSPEALTRLSRLIRSFVADDEIVGAELLVIKNGRTVLHEACGFRDREAEVPMETGSVFCVRSMTKPVIGAAILTLIEDGVLALGDRVSQHLPSFAVAGSRDITVEHLLTHTSGLPMSLILGADLRKLSGIQAVAALGGGHALAFAPGSAFSYSDQGTDTLTALVEVVTGMPAADFVAQRVLAPLGMRDSACVLTEKHPLRARACSKYAGTRGEWTRFWSPDQPPLFPFFLGSQGLYSTLEDYARFMELWLREGRIGEKTLLEASLVHRALTPSPQPFAGSTGLPGLLPDYGWLMQLWTGPGATGPDGEVGAREVVAFGHSGSDGTHAWVFPDQQAMVLYFTQSRSNSTGLRVEEALGELFLGVPHDPTPTAAPHEDYLGYYWEGEGDLYRAIIRDGEDLALEIMGKAIVPLTYVGEDRWKFRPDPRIVLAFERSGMGAVTGYTIGDHREHRFAPSAELPSAEVIAARVAKAHRLDRVESLGPLRMRGELTMAARDLEGELTALVAWPDLFRVDTVLGEESERYAFDGERAWSASATGPATALESPRAEQLRQDHPLARFGDWHRLYPRLRVIQRITRSEREVLVVRAGDTSAPATTLYVDAETGRVLREERMAHVDRLGRIGRRLTFADYRDVSGMQLPFKWKTEFAHPLIGAIVTTITAVDLGVELPEGTFGLEN